MNLSDEPSEGEFEVIERLRGRLPVAPPGELWLGDDAALVGDGWLLATDALVGGLDWDPDFSAAADVGWKAVMVNASDLAAMGAHTERLLVTVVAPGDFDIDGLYDGIAEACSALGAAVIGGDLSDVPRASDTVVVSIAAAGHCPGGRPVTRAGARPGDGVWLSGPVGLAAAGLRMLRTGVNVDPTCARAHTRPQARVAEGVAAAAAGATAMIDISDGLVADAWHLARASRATVLLDNVAHASHGQTVDEILGGGDDYELLCTLPASVELVGWRRVGVIEGGGPGVTIGGEPSEPRGYKHWRRA